MRAFLGALQFLTILPVRGAHQLNESDWGRATAWYPAVGLVLGALLAGLDWGLGWLLPGGVVSALLLVAWVALTGALHLDGFVDCCDALLASVSRERRLEILRDVHVGAFGVVGAVLLLLVKYVTLATLPAVVRLPALLLIPTLGRWGMTGAVLLFPYARSGAGLGQKAKAGAGSGQLAIATLTALAAAGLAWWLGLGWSALALLILTAVAVLALGGWVQSKLGGLTGDVYGAICELVETTSLLALTAFVYRGVLP
ncbi:MAG TPA: adenosylcobinamide-GDP ribazoletransferase [Anaerolineae bacterium]|nr:adenosylcobinamide-GDP ribazoletransferase [Anaerolineae bacterium]